MLKLKAKFAAYNMDGQNHSGDKEEVSHYTVVAYDKGEFKIPVRVRCWTGRSKQASVIHAAIWVSTKKGGYCAGHGSAGGYGYHKESAAIEQAITSAGITLWGSVYCGQETDFKKRVYIGGVGDSAIKEALEAIARAAGYRRFTIV